MPSTGGLAGRLHVLAADMSGPDMGSLGVGPNAVNLRKILHPNCHPGESRGPERLRKTGFRLSP
jgi:hypothetical protein